METEQQKATRPAFCRAIYTRYVGPTDTKGSRIIATEPIGRTRIVRSYDSALDSGDAHATVASELVDILNAKDGASGYMVRDWSRALCGESADGRGYVYLVPLAEATSTDGGAL